MVDLKSTEQTFNITSKFNFKSVTKISIWYQPRIGWRMHTCAQYFCCLESTIRERSMSWIRIRLSDSAAACVRLPAPSIVHLSLGDRIVKEKLRKAAAGASEYQFICYHPYVAGAILTAKELTSTWFLRQNSSVYTGHCVRRNWLAVCYSPGFSPISTGNGNQQMDKEGVERGSWLGKKTKREESIFYCTVRSCDVTTHAKPGKSLDFSRRLLVLSSI
jgi:hypothetical protein